MKHFTGNTSASLAVLCVAQFVVVLDVTIVAIALPAVGADLGFSPAALSWVLTAYTIVLAGLLILGGRAADLAGARWMFAAGLVAFSLSSAVCAAAWSPSALIAARVAQGCGAALLSPAALACLNEVVPPEGRSRALGWWTAAAAGGGAGGWVLGGLITELAGWRWVFAVNVPIGLAALALTARCLPRSPRTGDRRDLNITGALLVTAGIAVGVLGLSWLSGDLGSVAGWAAAAGGGLLLLVFRRHERRSPRRLIPLALPGRPGVLGGNLTAVALTGSTTPAMITVVLYVQETLRLSPGRGALLFPAFNAAVIAGSLAGPWILGRTGHRAALIGGFTAVAAGAALLLALPPGGLPIGTLSASFAAMGGGLGIASVASTSAGTIRVPGDERGVAAGLLNATAQLGSALGLAVTVPLVASAAPMTGYRLGFAAAAAIAVAGVLATLTVPRVRDRGSLRPWWPDGGGRARGPASTAPERATQAAGSARLPALGGVVGEPTRPRFR